MGFRPPVEEGVVVAVGARLLLDRCRIGTARQTACIWIDWAEQVEVRQCQLAAPAGIGVTYRDLQPLGVNRPRTLRMERTTSFARIGMFLDLRPDPRCEIIMSHCLFLGESGLHVETPRLFEALTASPGMTIESRHGVFDCDALMTAWTRVAEGPLERIRTIDALPRRVAWRGEANVFPPAMKMLLVRPMNRFPATTPPMAAPYVVDLEGWRRFWPATEHQTALRESRYGAAQVLRAKLPAVPRSQTTLERAPGEDTERWIERLELAAGLHAAADIALQ